MDKVYAAQEVASGRTTIQPLAADLLVQHGIADPSLGRETDGSYPIRRRRRRVVPSWLQAEPNFLYLCRLLEGVQLQLAELRYQALKNGTIVLPEAPRNEVSTSAQRSNRTVGELLVAYIDRKQNAVSASRMAQFRLVTRAMQEEWGEHKTLSEITREDCKELINLIARTPPYVSQHYRGKTLRQAADAYLATNGRSAERQEEAGNQLAVLVDMFELAKREEWVERNVAITIEPPSARRQKVHEAHERSAQPFTIDELQRIFASSLYAKWSELPKTRDHFSSRDHSFWAPLIALWTGARQNEILQLERGDVRRAGEVPYLQITDETEIEYDPEQFDKRIKARNSLRAIPIHPELVRLGFLDWASTRNPGRLFPEASKGNSDKPSDIYSKRFKRVLEQAGVWVPRRKVFHSFRDTFNDALRRAHVGQELREAICGWKSQRSMDSRYGEGHLVRHLYEACAKVEFPGLDLTHLRP